MNLNIKPCNILVIGDIMVDHYIYGDCNRISPEAPVLVVEISSESYTLGGAGNVLKNLNALGAKTEIVAIVGDDENAAVVYQQLELNEIQGKGIVKDAERCTIMKSRVLSTNHQLIRLDREKVQPLNKSIEERLFLIVQDSIAHYDLVLVSDYNKGLLTESFLQSIIALCRQQNKVILVDPKGNDFSKYRGVNIIKPNRKEAGIAAGIVIKDAESLKLACQKIQEVTACDSVIVTMSEDGIAILTGDQLEIIPTKAQDVIDVTGAGDTVLAALGVALASGNSLHDACQFANQAAAIVVSKVGSATVTVDEVNQRFFEPTPARWK